MKKNLKLVILLGNMVLGVLTLAAHPGKTDANGGHTDKSTGSYHYHGGGALRTPTQSYVSPIKNLSSSNPVEKQPLLPLPLPPKLSDAEIADIDARTVAWLQKRAEAGSATAQYDLAIRYLEGKGVEKDFQKAVVLLQKAAQQEHSQAKKKLAELSLQLEKPSEEALKTDKQKTEPLEKEK